MAGLGVARQGAMGSDWQALRFEPSTLAHGRAWQGRAWHGMESTGRESESVKLQLDLTGVTPLAQHNADMVDPDNKWVKAIAEITSKRSNTRTEEDRDDMHKLEFMGGLYIDENGPYVPSPWIIGSIVDAAKIRRLGTTIIRAVSPYVEKNPLIYNGPRSGEELWKFPRFQWKTSVGVNGKRVMRMRPQFPAWQVSTEIELALDVMDLDTFTSVARVAGRAAGMGDGRRLGKGRYTVTVTELDDATV